MNRSYLRLGLLIGAAVFLAGNFATQGAGTTSSGLVVFWAGLGLGLGLLITIALERTSRSEEEAAPDEPPARLTSGDFKAVIPTSSRFYAVSRTPSSSELKALMVDAPTIPGNPISTRLQLIVERYDAYARVSLSEGSWLDYTVWEVAERACDAALSRIMATQGDADLELASIVSEGPLDEKGRSPFGWTFGFVDGALGASCSATVTASELLLTYRTAVSYPRSTEMAHFDPREVVEAARASASGLADLPLHLRVELPHEVTVWSPWPRQFFEIHPVEGTVVGAAPREPLDGPDREEALTVEALVETLTIAADSPFREDLLACRRGALQEAANELLAAHGPVVVGELAAATRKLFAEEPEATRSLIHVLGYVPSDLAQLALERLADELPVEMEGIAYSLFEKRRHEELPVHIDPLGGRDFRDSRRLLGKTHCTRLALRSTYNPETELLTGLERFGLRVTRVRLLSGDTELFLSANLSTDDRRTDALISSSPLPVPCHVMRVIGPSADELSERISGSDLVYSDERIVEDVLSGRPYDIHRGALYMAAMSIDAPQTFEALTDASRRHRTNVELRRACLAALCSMTHPEVDDFLEAIEDLELLDLARDLLSARAATTAKADGSEREEGSAVVESDAG